MDKKILMIMDEKSMGHQAELITVLEIDNEEYAVYSINKNGNKSNIYVSSITKDRNGNDVLKTINEEQKDKIFKIVQELLNAN